MMMPDLLLALNVVDMIEMAGIHIPPASRHAILTAIMSGAYSGQMAPATLRQRAHRLQRHTIIADSGPLPRPSFGL